jgi:hypothetical protein
MIASACCLEYLGRSLSLVCEAQDGALAINLPIVIRAFTPPPFPRNPTWASAEWLHRPSERSGIAQLSAPQQATIFVAKDRLASPDYC